MTDAVKKKEAFIISNFRDAGTSQAFLAGAIEQIPIGSYINYEAAGLVRKPTAEDRKETTKSTGIGAANIPA